jgi:hypothetical protein
MKSLLIGCIGHSRRRGHADLIKAFAFELVQARLLLIGDGPLKQYKTDISTIYLRKCSYEMVDVHEHGHGPVCFPSIPRLGLSSYGRWLIVSRYLPAAFEHPRNRHQGNGSFSPGDRSLWQNAFAGTQ